MESIPDHIYFKDTQSRFVRNNTAHARSLGRTSHHECTGKSDYDFFTADHADRAFADEQHIIQTGQPVIGKIERITRLDGSVFWGSATKMVWRDPQGRILGTFGITRDITAIKLAEDKLTEERNLLRTIIDHLPSRIFVKDTSSKFLINNLAHLQALGLATQDDARGKTTYDFFPGERGLQAIQDDRKVLASGEALLNQEKSDFAMGDRQHWSLTTKVPLRDSKGKVVGLVGISHDITERKRTEQELQRRTEEMEADLSFARQLQEAFFPKTYPVFPRGVPLEASELRFAHRYIPAATLGGDFFEIIQLSDTRCAVLVCDVMGHGVRAGLLTALIRGVVEESALRTDRPEFVIQEINRALMPVVLQTGQPIFATAFFALIDTAAGSLHFANAGHPPPLVVRADGAPPTKLTLPDPDPAAGLFEDCVFSSRSIPFAAGDTLLAYTDGLIEASNPNGEMYGEERLQARLTPKPPGDGLQFIETVVSDVIAFTGQTAFDDDLCAVVIECTGMSCALRPALTYEI